MKQLILEVQNKTKALKTLGDFCDINYVSKYLNIIGVQISDEKMHLLETDSNVLSFEESANGGYLTHPQREFALSYT